MPSKTMERSSFPIKRCNYIGDRISQLPDEVLVHILSFLAIQDAGRTSVISHRWKDLWKFTPCLNFDGTKGLDRLKKYSWKFNPRLKFDGTKSLDGIDEFCRESPELPKIQEQERSKYVSCVSQVLSLHKCPSIEKFRIMFQLDDDNACNDDIYEWIRFALHKRVKILEIDCGLTVYPLNGYSPSEECCRLFQSANDVRCLTSISLCRVNLSEQLLESLFSNCPLLERLSVACSNGPVNLKVVGPTLQLRYLEIFLCSFLKSVEISAPKLVTFKFVGEKITQFNVGNNPLLSELVIGGHFGEPVTGQLLRAFSRQISQLQTINLKFGIWTIKQMPQFPEFRNLKHLVLQYTGYQCRSLLNITDIIVAAPYLHRITLKLRMIWSDEKVQRIRNSSIPHPLHHCLKYVTLDGYAGGTYDSELSAYLLKHAINLEKIDVIYNEMSPREGKQEEQIREGITWLEQNKPARCDLLVNGKKRGHYVVEAEAECELSVV